MKIYLIYGPQGSGKSTQAEMLAKKFKLIFISTGQISRAIAAQDTDIGRKVKALIDSGNPTPNEIIEAAVEKIMDENKDGPGFVFDGYPRYVEQIEPFIDFLDAHQWEITKAIVINLSEEEGVKRVMFRAGTEGRKDDTPAGIAKRLELYHQQTKAIIDYFKVLGKVIEVDGSGTVDQVFQLILQALNLYD